MTPRSRKPVIINCDPPMSIPCHISNHSISSESSNSDTVYDSSASSMKNDSDFVSTDESCPSSSCYIKYKKIDETRDNNTSKDKSSSSNDNFTSLSGSALSERRKRILQERNYHKLIDSKNPGCQMYNVNQSKARLIEEKLFEESDSQCSPNVSLMNQNDVSLSVPFLQYLQCRSVLTGSPVDLSFTSGPEDYCENLSEGKMTDSLLYCMDGNVPPDLTLESDFNCSDKEALIRNNDSFPINIEGASINKSKISSFDSKSNSNLDLSMKKYKILQRYDGFVSNVGLVTDPTDKENVSPANKRTAQSLDQEVTEIKKGNITSDSDKMSKEVDKSTILNEGLTGNPDFWDYSRYGPLWETNL